jgi:hypothetical protein
MCDIVEIIVSSSGVGPLLFEVQESSFVGFSCAQESWFLLIAKVFVAVVESCLHRTCVVMSMSQDMCLLIGQKCSQQGAHGTCSSEALAATSMKKRILRLVLYLTLHHHSQSMWCLRHRFLSSLRNLRKKLEHKASEDFGHQEPFWRAMTI